MNLDSRRKSLLRQAELKSKVIKLRLYVQKDIIVSGETFELEMSFICDFDPDESEVQASTFEGITESSLKDAQENLNISKEEILKYLSPESLELDNIIPDQDDLYDRCLSVLEYMQEDIIERSDYESEIDSIERQYEGAVDAAIKDRVVRPSGPSV